jgi:hypothetical protein
MSTGESTAAVRTLQVGSNGNLSILTFDDASFTVTRQGAKDNVVHAPLRQVLWATCTDDGRSLEIHLLARKKKKSKSSGLGLVNVNGQIASGTEKADVLKWVEDLMQAAYRGMLCTPFLCQYF